MSRETKVGLIVVCSFLSLVAGVFIVKYTDFGNKPPITDNDDKTVVSAESMKSPSIPAAPTEAPKTDPMPSGLAPVPLTPPPGENPRSSMPIALTPPDITPTRFETPPTDSKKPDSPPVIDLPGSEPKKPSSPPTIELPGSEPKKPDAPPVIDLPGSEPKKPSSPPTIELPGSEPKKPDAPPVIDLPGSEPKKPSTPPTIELPGSEPKKPVSIPTDITKPMSPPLVDLPMPEAPPKPKDSVTIPGSLEPPPKINVPDSVPPAPLKGVRTPDPWTTVDPPKLTLPDQGKPTSRPVDPVPTPATDAPAVRLQLPTNGNLEFPDPAVRTRPEESPRVDSYDEEWYSCQAGDTLERISQRFFNSDKYAQALRLHNLDRDGRDLWRQDRPALQAGDVVKVPPARILERNHPTAVPGFKGTPASRPTPTAAMPAGGDFTHLTSSHPVNATSPPGYEVPRENMSFRDVARETLGSSDKWMLIFRLNRGFNPEQTLPKGATLRLPSDARLP